MPEISRTAKPYWSTRDGETARFYLGDVVSVLRGLPSGSAHCVVTSPPYWGLRDYGTGTWSGGDPACDHDQRRREQDPDSKEGIYGGKARDSLAGRDTCRKCGAVKQDLQIGSEPSPDCGTGGKAQCGRCFVCSMVKVFAEVRRVLRDDGTLWLNLGDSYAQNVGKGFDTNRNGKGKRSDFYADQQHKVKTGLPSGNLVGVPWRVALALQADGWVLRQDVVWHKPAPMPESVRNRCTKAHEYVFLLTKRGSGYYYDAEAIKERALQPQGEVKQTGHRKYLALGHANGTLGSNQGAAHRNKRSVWTVSSGGGYEGAHFATFPGRLIEPMILAGTSERGCCPRCGAGWVRVVERERVPTRPGKDGKVWVPGDNKQDTGDDPRQWGSNERYREKERRATEETGNRDPFRHVTEFETVGWEPGCKCPGVTEADLVPAVVLDPFVGSGTSVLVANRLGRRGWGVDLSREYLDRHCIPRVRGSAVGRREAMAEVKPVVVGRRVG